MGNSTINLQFSMSQPVSSWAYIPTLWGVLVKPMVPIPQGDPDRRLVGIDHGWTCERCEKCYVFWASKNFGRETGRGYLSGNFWPSRNSWITDKKMVMFNSCECWCYMVLRVCLKVGGKLKFIEFEWMLMVNQCQSQCARSKLLGVYPMFRRSVSFS